ncbi:MAG: hypothetical protein U0263_20945 [Polyangiaceae bacterium]
MRGVALLILGLGLSACESGESSSSAGGGGAGAPGGGGAPSGGASGSGGNAGSAGSVDSGLGGAADSGTNIAFPELALAVSGSGFVTRAGAPFVPNQAISCCGGGYGWPLVDTAWIDFVRGYGVNWLHVRLGPWRTVPGAEDEWALVGGAYAEQGGLAVLEQFNPAFWAKLEELVSYAGTQAMRVEIDVVDGWGLKHALSDDYGPKWPYHPWSAWNNSGGVDHVTAAGTLEIPAGSVYDAWVRKVAEHTCKYGNVTLEDGNEISLKQGYVPAFSQSIGNIYWDECKKRGFLLDGVPFRPLLGTQSESADTLSAPQIAYGEFHKDSAIAPSLCQGKPCGVNEYNPDPPLAPLALASEVCAARQAGTWFSYWRHGQSAAQMAETLSLIQSGCP